jgi:hypothetical protein
VLICSSSGTHVIGDHVCEGLNEYMCVKVPIDGRHLYVTVHVCEGLVECDGHWNNLIDALVVFP